MPAVSRSAKRFALTLLAILVFMAAWRITTMARMSGITRDGAVFCWYAHDLGQQGWHYLQSPAAHQHPLFPTCLLVTQRIAQSLGAPDTPLTWQYSGQTVALLAGLTVIILAGALTARLVHHLALPINARIAVPLAMLLAGLLDLNIWLSADVMSDQIHLAFYLGAVFLLLRFESSAAAAGVGLLAGLAFLTRQEGFVPILGGLYLLALRVARAAAAQRRAVLTRAATHAALLILAFLVVASPYWFAVGSFSRKKSLDDLLKSPPEQTISGVNQVSTTGGHSPALETRQEEQPAVLHFARLERLDVPWYLVLPRVLERLLRAGRVIVPFLALIPLITLRRQLLGPVLGGATTCAAAHLALTCLLISRFGYLAPRHLLVIVMLLTPLAALLLARIYTLIADVKGRYIASAITALFFLPLLPYALRVPNEQAAHIYAAAHWLNQRDPHVASRDLISATMGIPIAFYTDMHWREWDTPDHPAELINLLNTGDYEYYALELPPTADTGDHFEREGNRQLLRKVLAAPTLKYPLTLVYSAPGPAGSELRLYAVGDIHLSFPEGQPTVDWNSPNAVKPRG